MSTISEISLEFLHGYTMTLRNSLTSLVYEPMILRAIIEIVHEIVHIFLNCAKTENCVPINHSYQVVSHRPVVVLPHVQVVGVHPGGGALPETGHPEF